MCPKYGTVGINGLAISLSGRQLGVEDSLEVVVVVDGPVPVSGVCLLDVDQREVGQAAEALHHTVELSQIGHERGSGCSCQSSARATETTFITAISSTPATETTLMAKVQHLQRTQCYNGHSSTPATETTLEAKGQNLQRRQLHNGP